MSLAVPVVDGLCRGEEPFIVGRADLVQVSDRDHTAGLQDTRRPVDLRFRGDPVVSGSREHGVKTMFPYVGFLEVTDYDRQGGRWEDPAQLGGHGGADLDSANVGPPAEQVTGRLASTWSDLKDYRMAGQEPKQSIEHGRWIVGPYPVVDLCDAVEGPSRLCGRGCWHRTIVPVTVAGHLADECRDRPTEDKPGPSARAQEA